MARERRTTRRYGPLAALAALLLAAASPLTAEELRGRLRVALEAGGMDYRAEVRSNAANILTLVQPNGEYQDRFIDPRSDEAIDGRLEIRPPLITGLSAQYGLTRRLLFDASLEYHRTDVSDVEIHQLRVSGFRRIAAGDLERIPLRVGLIARWRPEHRLNPFLGGGAGYSFIGFDPSPELDALSLNLDASVGTLVPLLPRGQVLGNGLGLETLGLPPPRQLGAAQVEARDSTEVFLQTGVEYSLSRRWTLTLRLRLVRAARSLRITFDGASELGASVPRGTLRSDDPRATAPFGPLWITEGGLFDADGDGAPDPGLYYVQGGELSYDGLSATVGVGYTF